jgi:hypothetical protein
VPRSLRASDAGESRWLKVRKELLAKANASGPKLTPKEAAEKMRSSDVVVVDVRDLAEAGIDTEAA